MKKLVKKDLETALENISNFKGKLDFCVTHTCPQSFLKKTWRTNGYKP